jgi:tetratricopeptide (TPR) repeat protein
LNARLTDVETLAKQLNIERYLLVDKNYAMAIDQYQRILKAKPNAAILSRLGVLYFQLDPKNNKDKAIDMLDMAKRLEPGYWETYRNLSYVYSASGRTNDAIEAGQKALQLNPNDAITLSNVAWAYSRSTNPQSTDLEVARQYAQKALTLTGAGEKKSEILDTLAEVYYHKGGDGDRDRSLAYFRQAITLAPNWDVQTYRDHLKTDFPDEKP